MHLPLSIGRIAGVWLAMAVAMSANGVVRETVFKRVMSTGVAGVVSAVLGIVLIGVITKLGFRPLRLVQPTTSQLVGLSLVLVVLTVTFETAMGLLVDRKSWRELLDHYAIWRGELWPIIVVWLAMTPFVWSRGTSETR